jgi:hypothetical protein
VPEDDEHGPWMGPGRGWNERREAVAMVQVQVVMKKSYISSWPALGIETLPSQPTNDEQWGGGRS